MPSIAVKRKYEAIYIIKPDATDEQINATIQRYKGIVENAGGEVEKTGVWERRKLAYEIKGYTEGIFVLLNFIGEATVEAELRRIFQISSGEDQIRYMIVKPEESEGTGGRPSPELTETVQRPAPAPAPVAEAPAAAPVAEAPAAAPVAEAAPEAAPAAEAPAEPVAAAEEPAPVA
jgi:small subunit ribosomal protein S6